MAEIFQPVRGTESDIQRYSVTEGYVYFAYDTGNIYMDKDGARYLMGGSSTGIVYADGDESLITKDQPDVDADYHYTIALAALENSQTLPLKDSLILNSDGRFFRVLSTDDSLKTINALLLAVSGTGGGGGGGGGQVITVYDLKLEWDESTISQGHTFVYGAPTYAVFTPTATTGDSKVSLIFTIVDRANGGNEITLPPVASHNNGTPYYFDTSALPLSSNMTLKITVSASNSQMPDQSRTYSITYLRTVEMGIKKAEDKYLSIILPENVAGTLSLNYIPIGDRSISEKLHISVDDDEIEVSDINPDWYGRTVGVNIPRQPHGSHVISLMISATVNGRDLYTDPITFEAAWAEENNEEPIIWFGKYDSTVIRYENSYIEYMVYDPVAYFNGLPASVQIYKNGQIINEMSLSYSSSAWAELDISSIYDVGENVFTIACRGSRKDVSIYVTEEGSRDLGLAQANTLLVNYSSAGRSSLEVKSTRNTWKDSINNTEATLSGFNWQNNGWRKDAVDKNGVDSGTYLSVANSAQVSIPVPSIGLNYDKDYTIEIRFRIRNVQQYSTLVQTLPKYFYQTLEGTKSAESQTMSWINEHGYTVWYDEYGSPLMDESVEKMFETEKGVICKWMNNDNYGLVLGSQETYFRSPRGVISVRYKEDEIVNISCVVQHGVNGKTGLVYIYLNGILSGADALPPAGDNGFFTIASPFVFNSNYCDVDLYRFRVFQTGLTMPDVIHNYLSDLHSIALYDQNQLTDALSPTSLDFNLLVQYNENHPDNLTMPYAVWKIKDASRAEKLPYFKGDGCKVDIEFVNPSLDKALEDGVIDEWYYYTHSPSFVATDVDIDVQGTSSQGYPRRNYKTKYKKATSWTYTKGSLAGKSVTKKYTVNQTLGTDGKPLPNGPVSHTLKKKFHMDNEEIGVNKFTWKIDYMESSGSYNTGFANLLGNPQYPLYTKHPIEDIGFDGTGLRTTVYGYPVLTFHQYENPSNNPSNPGITYEYIGRYNMNLDKSANEAYGFEIEEEQPFINKSWTQKIKDDDGNVTETIQHDHPWISQIAECWELEDNQGTWCSFKYPTPEARATGFGTSWPDNPDRLEIMRHFEYRYSPYGDQLDAIGADGKYDGKVPADKPEIGEEIGSTDAEKSAYARNVYSNLEVLFNWLDSTDATNATNEALAQPVTYKTSVRYMMRLVRVDKQDGTYTTEKWYCNSAYEPLVKVDDPGITLDANKYYVYMRDGVNIMATAIAPANYEGMVATKADVTITYTTDSAAYRLDKFRNEFSKHLDKEYCLVYFVLTELLLCYDSRGKNMMLASFGPHEAGGDYIWYPIFYDIDTQLGLNNSGAYLWDYDADVTLEGLFSTPTSVLWTNLYTVFGDDIANKYKVLRGSNDGTIVSNNLTYEKIAGAYECNPEVFGSYAMKGLRPVIAIGLDEYYKYFATMTTGYFDTSGNTIIEDTPQFAYQCQGDKKLTTELLLRNRLNYIDSWWLGGDYDINQFKQGQFWGRVNGNRGTLTSDKYLDLTTSEINELKQTDPKYNGFTHGDYPVSYFDSQPGFKLKPFLKQYVTYFTDEVPETPVKYSAVAEQADGVWTHASANTLATYKNTPESPNEQLTYLPALDYLSSMGDLSTSYFSEFHLTAGKRLLDLTLGSDVPGYENKLLDATKPFDIADGPNSNTKKSLLKKVVLTNMTTFDKTIDVQGSEKLQEFRALNTILQGVYFADGAPLHTVHLPKTITTLKLVENKDLTKILTNTPVVAVLDRNGNAVYRDPETYKGLYLQDITDYTDAKANTGHSLYSLIIEGGNLHYDSYTILNNLIKLKDQAATQRTLKISLKDVQWTPYELVQSGETQQNGVQYYKLNDHSMFEQYTPANNDQWASDTLNGLIYTKNDSLDTSVITDTSLLDKLIDQYELAKAGGISSQFANTSVLNTATMPTITGTMFIANADGDAIDEADLTEKYASKEYFPNLSIQAEKINEANVTKYVRVLDNGIIENTESPRRSNSVHPLKPQGQVPAKAGYDFVGWATDPAGNNMFVEYYNARSESDPQPTGYINIDEAYNSYTFTNDNKVLTLYAIFRVHSFAVNFYNYDGSLIETILIPDQAAMQIPSIIPYKDDSDLPLTETYHFEGYSLKQNDSVPITEPLPAKVKKDYNCYAIFSRKDVHAPDNILQNDGYYVVNTITIKGSTYNELHLTEKGLQNLTGKITLPSVVDGKPIQVFNNTVYNATTASHITHIFWQQNNNELMIIGTYACRSWEALRYFELPNENMIIMNGAFNQAKQFFAGITQEQLDEFFEKIYSIGDSAFYSVGTPNVWVNNSGTLVGKMINLPNINSIENVSFGYLEVAGFTFGSPTNTYLDAISNWPTYVSSGNFLGFLSTTTSKGVMGSSGVPVQIIYYDNLDKNVNDAVLNFLNYNLDPQSPGSFTIEIRH